MAGERGAVEVHAIAGINLSLPVKRQMIAELSDQHMGEKSGPGLAARDGQSRHRLLRHRLAFAARTGRTDMADHFEAAGDVIQDFGDVLAYLLAARYRTTRYLSAVRMAPPQAGQAWAGSWTISRRGSASGSLRRFFFAETSSAAGFSPLAGGAGAAASASASAVSSSSSLSSSCSNSRCMRSDEAPKVMRLNRAISILSFSTSSVLTSRPALARRFAS